MIKFTVYGEPVAQGRPKFTMVNGHGRAYDPEKSRNYKAIVRDAALPVRPDKPIEGAIRLSIKAYRSVPKSWSQRKHKQALGGTLRPVTKPDLDNIIKGVKDALKTVIWRDDSQVVELFDCGKWYSEVPRVEIIIAEVNML